MLSEKEKKAIDILQNQIADYIIGNYCAKCGDFTICENKDEDCYYIQAIDTVLNLITKLQKENENITAILDYKDLKSLDTVLSLIKEQEEEIEKYEKIYKEYDCYRWVKELNKKDKQIDLMAESIELQQYANIDTSNLDLVCEKLKCNKKCELVKKDCIKQYFADLVEKE